MPLDRPEKPFFRDASYQDEYFTTFDLKQRGWTATMIKKLLPEHDAEKENFMRIPTRAGRRKIQHPVKLYEQERIKYLEDTEEFYVLYEKAQKALARGEKRRETVLEQKRQKVEADVDAYQPKIDLAESWHVNLRRHRDRVASLRENWEEARIPEDIMDEATSRLKEEFRDAYHQQKHPGKKRPRKKVVLEDDW
ncbi:hypothetical protein [Deinococcus cellulosilyticus]|uniref:Uncharacterized protein n=1 Tax=Deinococcus cellulosilyticus (strain DSM 18568 / NBRC 106333 / KACC 11606 / 5516J-15) TaxID=1223518 RepID=A0A511N222_DEIC1|nr:hypothetical protein [Deinococcus cellulosilyticus]GEM46902.1 hypothetical protein DC3_25370 [Deinococcus cellulosilyticus NBRC 106333 = KACC 11606]